MIGCPFYVMERIPGEVIVSSVPATLDSPAERRRIGEQLIDALVEIHAVDWQAAGLEGFGKPTGYLERQLRRFGGLWEINKTREIPAVERVGAWLSEHLPNPDPPTQATIVHGDYRLGNTIFAADAPARLESVLDWEMATIGDPAGGPRVPVHDVDRGRRPEGRDARVPRRRHAPRGLSHARGTDRPVRAALGPLDAKTSAGTRRSRCGSRSCSWRATTSARSRARPTIRI